jgi:DNA repair protein RadC
MAENTNPHTNHRKRLRKRFLNEGIDNFEDHNVLELLLFFSIPRRDTNEIAHALLEKFGSLSNVFTASVDQLCTVKGIGESSAVLIKMIPQIWKKFAVENYLASNCIADIESSGEYLTKLFIGAESEQCYMLIFNEKGKMTNTVEVDTGDVSSVYFSPRILMDIAVKYGASSFILSHNHLTGSTEPSTKDIMLTRRLCEVFDIMGIPMRAHIIVSGSEYRVIDA